VLNVRVFCRVVLTGVLSAVALCGFLASFDGLMMSKSLAGKGAQTLRVRIWNSLNLQAEPTIAAVSGLLIGVASLILSIEGAQWPQQGQHLGRG
jgi:putative spermidine/putrescine transport system permease protein